MKKIVSVFFVLVVMFLLSSCGLPTDSVFNVVGECRFDFNHNYHYSNRETKTALHQLKTHISDSEFRASVSGWMRNTDTEKALNLLKNIITIPYDITATDEWPEIKSAISDKITFNGEFESKDETVEIFKSVDELGLSQYFADDYNKYIETVSAYAFDSAHLADFNDYIYYVITFSDEVSFSKEADWFPYEKATAFIKGNLESVVTDNALGGYYSTVDNQKENSNTLYDPLGFGEEGVGTYRIKKVYEYYGDFAVEQYSKDWYGTDKYDKNNVHSTSFYCKGETINIYSIEDLEKICGIGGDFFYYDDCVFSILPNSVCFLSYPAIGDTSLHIINY